MREHHLSGADERPFQAEGKDSTKSQGTKQRCTRYLDNNKPSRVPKMSSGGSGAHWGPFNTELASSDLPFSNRLAATLILNKRVMRFEVRRPSRKLLQ